MKQQKTFKTKDINLPNEEIKKIFEQNYYNKSFQDVDNSDVTINHLENIFTNETYYLHKSDIKLPDQETCNKAQEQALTNLTDAEVEQIKELLREAHLKLEYELIDAVRLIKDPTSPYWEDFTTEGIFTDPFNGIKVDNGGRFLDVLNQMEEIIQIEKEAETKKDLELMCNILKEGMEEHNLNKCFESHEILHDYDYFVFNTPVHLEVEPADWEGVETYFGRVSIMQ